MSVSLFFVNPVSESEKRFNIPILTENEFAQYLLPAAERAGAAMVCQFGVGIEVRAADMVPLEGELQSAMQELVAPHETEERVEGRVRSLIVELRQVFDTNAAAVLYIG